MNKHAYIFPGQGAQFSGMGKNMFETNDKAKELFNQANDILGFNISSIMFSGTDEELKQTSVTQPAIFLHSVIAYKTLQRCKTGYGCRPFVGRIFCAGCKQCFKF